MAASYLQALNELGIEQGDTVDVVSDLRSIMLYCRAHCEKFDADELLDALKELVGSQGTVMVRSFTWDWCNKGKFDYAKSPSQVGSLGTMTLSRDDFKRTRHPIYSWCVWGKHKEGLCGLDNRSAFAEDSPFGFLEKYRGKMLRLGDTQIDGMTALHYIEQELKVSYRFEKEFRGVYIDENGDESERTYSMFVRNLSRDVRPHPVNIEPLYLQMGVMDVKELNGLKFASIKYHEAYDLMRRDFKENEGRTVGSYEGRLWGEGNGQKNI